LAIARMVGLALLGVLAGVSFVVQASVNSQLRTTLQSASWAALVSYAGGTLTTGVIVLALREPWPRAASIAGSDWWSWTGGLFGAIYVMILIVLLPRLGAAAVLALLVTGQMTASLGFDHFALFGLPRHPIALSRVVGVALLVSGVLLVRR